MHIPIVEPATALHHIYIYKSGCRCCTRLTTSTCIILIIAIKLTRIQGILHLLRPIHNHHYLCQASRPGSGWAHFKAERPPKGKGKDVEDVEPAVGTGYYAVGQWHLAAVLIQGQQQPKNGYAQYRQASLHNNESYDWK